MCVRCPFLCISMLVKCVSVCVRVHEEMHACVRVCLFVYMYVSVQVLDSTSCSPRCGGLPARGWCPHPTRRCIGGSRCPGLSGVCWRTPGSCLMVTQTSWGSHGLGGSGCLGPESPPYLLQVLGGSPHPLLDTDMEKPYNHKHAHAHRYSQTHYLGLLLLPEILGIFSTVYCSVTLSLFFMHVLVVVVPFSLYPSSSPLYFFHFFHPQSCPLSL